MLSFTDSPRTEILRGTSFEDYRKAEGLNQSLMKLHDADYGGCPRLYQFRSFTPDDKDTQARRDGRTFHALLLEPNSFQSRYRTLDAETAEHLFQIAKAEAIKAKKTSLIATAATLAEFREKGGKNFEKSPAYLGWIAGDTREVVSTDFARHLEGMLDSIHGNNEIMDEIRGTTLADCEVSGFSAHTFKVGDLAGKSIQLKARFDLLPPGDSLIDAKTCRSTNHRKFSHDVEKYGYDLQAAHYIKVANANGLKKQRFGFLAAEKEPPYLCCMHWVPADWLDYERLRHRKILTDIAESIRVNRWPNPPSGMLEPPHRIATEIEALAA